MHHLAVCCKTRTLIPQDCPQIRQHAVCSSLLHPAKPWVTCAGCPEYELAAGGEGTLVTPANVEQYLAAVVDATLGSGVAAQLEAFRAGFCEVRPRQRPQGPPHSALR